MTADLPLGARTPRADMEQEEKNTDDCERLHVRPREKRLSPTLVNPGCSFQGLLLIKTQTSKHTKHPRTVLTQSYFLQEEGGGGPSPAHFNAAPRAYSP